MDEAIIDETELDLGPPTPRFEPGKTYVKAISTYKPQREDELALNTGEYVEVITKFPDSWWEGRSLASGRMGMFPSTFTQPYDPQKAKSDLNNSQMTNSSEDEVESDDDDSDEEEEEDDEDESSGGSESEDSESGSDEEDSEDEEEEEEESESEPEEEEEKPRPKSNPPLRIATPVKSSNSAPSTRIPTPKKVSTPPKLVEPSSASRLRSASHNGNAGSAIPQKERAKSADEKKSARSKLVEAMSSPKRAPKDSTDQPTPKKKKKSSKSKAVDPSGFLATLEGEDIRKYRDTLAAKEIEIQKLRKEVKTLTVLQKRQDRAIKTLDTEKGEMPRLLQGMHDELRVLREKLREYQARHSGDEKMMQTQHEEILKLKKQIEDQHKLLKSKGVDATTVNQKVKHIIEEKEKMINDLTQKAAILSRAKEMEEKKYRVQLKEYQSEIDKLCGEMDKLKVVLKEHGLNRIVRDVEKSPSPSKGRKSKNITSSSPSKKKEKTQKEEKQPKKKKEEVREPPVLPQRTEVSISRQPSQMIPTQHPVQQAPSAQPSYSAPAPVQQQPAPVQANYSYPIVPPATHPPEAANYATPSLPGKSTMQPMFSMGSSTYNVLQNTQAAASTTLEPSPRDDLSYRKKSPKNVVNPFAKLNEPSPPVTVPPVTMPAPAAAPVTSANPAAQRTTVFGGANNPNNPIFGSSSSLFGNTNSSFAWKNSSSTSLTTNTTNTTTNTAPPAPETTPPTTSPPTGTGNTGYVPSFSQPQEPAQPARPLFLGGGTQPPPQASETKPSWMFGPTAPTTQDTSTDVFKPNFGFNRKKDKDRWKVNS